MQCMVQESSSGELLDRDLFQKCVSRNTVLLTQAFRKKFVIPDFKEFTGQRAHWRQSSSLHPSPGQVKHSPSGVFPCALKMASSTRGRTKIPFCLQFCVKPLTYAISVSMIGNDHAHEFVGKEPRSLRCNKISLNEEGFSHNSTVKAGAIVVSSLTKMDFNKVEKFDFVLQYLNKMAGKEFMGFGNAIVQSEKETGDRNYTIGYYLKEKKCFPQGNGHNSCPRSLFPGKSILSAETVRNTFRLMHVDTWAGSPEMHR
ncbi:hypothetical protein U0070_019127 [Myodes glareolus]|uniref:glutaminase n=1 Tax=Myodes glareolus TaxID=447135 RepID=A0AAW0H9M8_MYOGA